MCKIYPPAFSHARAKHTHTFFVNDLEISHKFADKIIHTRFTYYDAKWWLQQFQGNLGCLPVVCRTSEAHLDQCVVRVVVAGGDNSLDFL